MAGSPLRRWWLRIYRVAEMKDATGYGLTAWGLIVMSTTCLKMLETGKLSVKTRVTLWFGKYLKSILVMKFYREENVSFTSFFWCRWILLEVLEKVYPGSVNWKHASKPPIKMPFKKVENCNQVVKIGKEMRFSLVNVDGNDIVQGNKKLILGSYSYFFF